MTSSGIGLQGVTVTLDSSQTATTDANGNYTFAGLANGSYTITPSKPDYAFNPINSTLTVDGSYITGVDFTAVGLAPFKEMATAATCSGTADRLFVIDGQLVFWDRQGNCADNAYSWTLFADTVDAELCSEYDSIAGPVSGCRDASYQAMFDTIISNLDKPDLGLGSGHRVEQISF